LLLQIQQLDLLLFLVVRVVSEELEGLVEREDPQVLQVQEVHLELEVLRLFFQHMPEDLLEATRGLFKMLHLQMR
jgi:hypothetical protein